MGHRISFCNVPICDPAGTRTQDPNIKSVMLYQLSYGIIHRRDFHPAGLFFGGAKIKQFLFAPNFYTKKNDK